MSRFLRISLSIVSAIIFSEAVINYGFLIWIAFIPILLAMRGENCRYKILYGFLCGSFISFYIFWPVLAYGAEYLCALSVYCGLAGSIIVGLSEYLREKSGKVFGIFIFPLVWVAFEFISSKGPISFPMSLALALYQKTALLQITSVTGPYGLSFLIMSANLIVFEWCVFFIEKKGLKVLAAVSLTYIAALSAILLWGANETARPFETNDDSPEIAIIQGSIPRWMYVLEKKNKSYRETIQEVYFGLTEKANRERNPDIVVWPEGAVNQWVPEIPSLKERILDIVKKQKNTMIIGAPYLDEEKNYYNAAFIIAESANSIERYEKIKLLPWVETHFSGKRQGIFDIKYGKIGILICFESIYPAMSRSLVKEGADLILVLTNDAGFNKTHLAGLHAREAILRAVENRCPVVRAAQSGISMVVDRFGRVRRKTELFASTIMYENVDFRSKERSFYNKRGDIFVYFCIILIFCGIGGRIRKR